jgi:amino acid transporter
LRQFVQLLLYQVSAPRLICAIANDRILPFLDVFIVQEGEEPRRALLLTATITLAGVLVGNLDLITPIITMFFLLCYLGSVLICYFPSTRCLEGPCVNLSNEQASLTSCFDERRFLGC